MSLYFLSIYNYCFWLVIKSTYWKFWMNNFLVLIFSFFFIQTNSNSFIVKGVLLILSVCLLYTFNAKIEIPKSRRSLVFELYTLKLRFYVWSVNIYTYIYGNGHLTSDLFTWENNPYTKLTFLVNFLI